MFYTTDIQIFKIYYYHLFDIKRFVQLIYMLLEFIIIGFSRYIMGL